MPPMRASGGRVDAAAVDVHKHEKAMHKGQGLTKLKIGGKVCRAEGGPVGGLSNKDGGAGGASGRLEKIKMYGK